MVSLGRIAVPWIVVTLVFLSTIRTSCAQNEFCYKMSWGAFNETLQKYEFDALVRPVTAFPAEHALVSTYGCMSEGDRIPHLGMSCPPLESDNAGEAWYAYDYPKSFSSNTGFEEAEYSTLYFIIDDVGKASFIINHDKPQNSDGVFCACLLSSVCCALINSHSSDFSISILRWPCIYGYIFRWPSWRS